MRVDQEDATEEGGGAGHLGEVLSCIYTGGVVVWGGKVSVVGTNDAEARKVSCRVPATGDEVEGKKAEGWFVAEGGGEQGTSGSRDTTDIYVLG